MTFSLILAFAAGYIAGMLVALALCFRLSNRYRKPGM